MAGIRHFGALLVGLSGWSYPEWKGSFYAGVPPRLWLARIAERFPAVEVNIGYYRWLRRSAIEGWIKQTPPAFRFAAKGPRTVTHVRRLKNVADVVAQQREIYGAFGDRLFAWHKLICPLSDDGRRVSQLFVGLDWDGPRDRKRTF